MAGRTRTAKQKKIAVVTGANRGLGLEACRQIATMGYRVVLTARGKTKGERAVAGLRRDGLDAAFCQLDVTDAASVRRLARFVARQGGRLDALVNNAGILIDGEEGPLGLKVAALSRTFETNVAGPLRVAQALAPLMDRGGRIVNVSSGAGQFKNLSAHWPAYGVSKAALNALTKTLAAELKDAGIKVNAVCPGWVRTDMGGPGADLSVEEGADTIVWLATTAPARFTGRMFRARQQIDW